MTHLTIAIYRPRPGQDQPLRHLLCDHLPILRSIGLATDRPPLLLRSTGGAYLELFEWQSAAAVEQAHSHPEVLAMWQRFDAVCEYGALAALPESGQLFPAFELVEP